MSNWKNHLIDFIVMALIITAAFFLSSGIKGCVSKLLTEGEIVFSQGDKLPKEVEVAVVNTVVLYTIDFIRHRPDLIEREALAAAALRLPYSMQKKEFKIPETANPYKVIKIEDFPEYLAYETMENLYTVLKSHHYSKSVLLDTVSFGILKGIVIAEEGYMPDLALKIYESEGHLNEMLLKYF